MRGIAGFGSRCRFWRSRCGTSAIEFALLVPLFLGVTFSLFETGWNMLRLGLLDRAVDQTVRDVRLGKEGSLSQTEIRSAICGRAMIFLQCERSLLVEMIPIDTAEDFPDYDAVCVDRGSKVDPVYRYEEGQRSQIVYLRACVIVDPITPLLGVAMHLPKDSTGGVALTASSAFLNEP